MYGHSGNLMRGEKKGTITDDDEIVGIDSIRHPR